MDCVILAAGMGTRLASAGRPKPLVRVAGLPLLERTIASAQAVGLDRFVVVTGHEAARVEELVWRLRERRTPNIVPVRSDQWQDGNGASLLAARHHVCGEFVLLMADHVVDDAILATLLDAEPEGADLLLATDFDVSATNPRDDATLVKTDGGRILCIGKDLADYDVYDTGVFRSTPALFSAVAASCQEGQRSLSGGVRHLAERERARAVDVSGLFWIDVDTAADRRRAQAHLCGSSGKARDGIVSRRLNRPVSARMLTPLLLRVAPGLTPNTVSLLGFAVALAGAVCFLGGWPLLAGIAIHLASVLDGSDGEVARLKRVESRFGAFFDTVLDRYGDALTLAAAAWFCWRAALPAGPVAVAAAAAVTGTLMVSYTSARAVLDVGHLYTGKWVAAGRGRDIRLLALAAGAVVGQFEPAAVLVAMVVIGVGTNLVVIRRMWVSWLLSSTKDPLGGGGIRAVVFDFDGTVADTMPVLSDLAVRILGEHLGLAADIASERYRQTVGLDFASQLEEIAPADPRNPAAAEQFETLKSVALLDSEPFADVVPMLGFLRTRGMSLFVCSSTTTAVVRAMVERWGLSLRVDECVGFEPGHGKDRQVRDLLDRYGLAPDSVLFVGDAPRDHDLVRPCGVRFLGVHRDFAASEFRCRGLASVSDLAEMTRRWTRWDRLRKSVEAPLAPASVTQGGSRPARP